jgi:hypothetical protein
VATDSSISVVAAARRVRRFGKRVVLPQRLGGRRRTALTALGDYYLDRTHDSSLLLLGYGRISEAVIRIGVRELAAAVRAAGLVGESLRRFRSDALAQADSKVAMAAARVRAILGLGSS